MKLLLLRRSMTGDFTGGVGGTQLCARLSEVSSSPTNIKSAGRLRQSGDLTLMRRRQKLTSRRRPVAQMSRRPTGYERREVNVEEWRRGNTFSRRADSFNQLSCRRRIVGPTAARGPNVAVAEKFQEPEKTIVGSTIFYPTPKFFFRRGIIFVRGLIGPLPQYLCPPPNIKLTHFR